MNTCKIEGCGNTKIKARGMCGLHYSRWFKASLDSDGYNKRPGARINIKAVRVSDKPCKPAEPLRNYDCVHYDECLDVAALKNVGMNCADCPKYRKDAAYERPAFRPQDEAALCVKCGKGPQWLAGECQDCHTARIAAIKKRNAEKIAQLQKPEPQPKKEAAMPEGTDNPPIFEETGDVVFVDAEEDAPPAPAPVKTCKVPACQRAAVARGFCSAHHRSWKEGRLKGFEPFVYSDTILNMAKKVTAKASGQPVDDFRPPCKVPGCAKLSFNRDLCRAHYEAWRSGRMNDVLGPFEPLQQNEPQELLRDTFPRDTPAYTPSVVEKAKAERDHRREASASRIRAFNHPWSPVKPPASITLDFSKHPDALAAFKQAAEDNFRTTEGQILCTLVNASKTMSKETR